MSLKNLETGQAATPLEKLQKINEVRRAETENGLLKEALAISNERSNSLIEQQNKLIEGIHSNITLMGMDLTITIDKAVQAIRAEKEKTEKLNESIAMQVRKAVLTSANDMKAEMLLSVKETLSKTQEEIKQTEKAIEKQREDMRMESGFRKFLFWATPVLLLAQTFAILFLIFG